MIVIPAIEVRGGRCQPEGGGQGFSDDPAGFAQQLIEAGAKRVHLTNLDAGRGIDDPKSRRGLRAALRELSDHGVAVQVSAAIRSHTTADFWLESGANEVVVGNLAVYRPDIAGEICHLHPGRVLLGLDVRGPQAHPEGWPRDAGVALDHVRRWSTWPSAGLIRISRPGTAIDAGELNELRSFAEAFRRPVIAAGIADSLADLAQCAAAALAAVIISRGQCGPQLDMSEAIRLFPGAELASPLD